MREMESHGEQTHFVKRVVLPSGKTIEVVYFKETDQPQPPAVEETAQAIEEAVETPLHPPAEPHQDLHVCCECSSELVYPVQWEESGPENWSVLLHCPNCDVYREGIFTQDTVETFDEERDRGADALARDYKRLMRANMADEIDRFVGALNADAILPEDF
jgi:hypothetical protein